MENKPQQNRLCGQKIMIKFIRLLSEQTGEILPIFDKIAELPPIRETVTHRISDRFS